MVRRVGLIVVSSLLGGTMWGQQPVSALGMGTVTGHVICGDTQRPARFAEVVLLGIPAQVTERKKVDPAADIPTQMAAMTLALKTVGKTTMAQVETGMDGRFEATDVAPGDYYLFAGAAGYVSPMNRVQAMAQEGLDFKKPLPGVTIVHVAAGQSSTGDVVLSRGAAVSGTVTWDDGSPVSGAMMSVIQAKGEQKDAPPQFGMLALAGILSSLMNISDDQGHFRLSGLPDGEYVIQASIKAGQQFGMGGGMNMTKMMAYKPLLVFSPGVFRKADAKGITLHTGDNLAGVTMSLNVGHLHTVSGHVRSVEDHHGINSGIVTLQDSEDKTFVRSAAVDAVGGYSVTFVPEGNYTLKVAEAEDTEPDTEKKADSKKPLSGMFGADQKTIRSYVDGKSSVIVLDKDVADANLELAIDKHPKSEADYTKMMDAAMADDDGKAAK
ncbi:MAG TPA: carboxypeptidase-like regulatory domain-containing protein [Acidobacteriaceae bacterium]|nr:carboxypeptidase-like regulatory domain-containing protein [Acidobacteriaceae bacterium]